MFGTGGGARTIYSMLNLEKVEIVAFADNNVARVGTSFYEKPVISPQNLIEMDYDYIIIASQYYQEIRDGLKALGICDKKIISGFEISDIVGNESREELFSSGPVIKYNALKLGKNKFFTMDDAFYGFPGTIGIHIHLYYIDLLDDFYNLLSQIPFAYDLYISITEIKFKRIIELKLQDLINLNFLKVEVVPNKGRDVAPFVVTFAKELLQYDYICHLHSKKSLRTGIEQSEWRNHLLFNLLGNEDVIRRIFSIFDKYEDIGLVYPTTFSMLPYWAHTWLSNKGIAGAFLKKLGIKIDYKNYFDYPVGNMFWAKSKALEKLLSLGLTYQDFEEEVGQVDGSIAHVIERSIAYIANNEAMTFAEIDINCNVYSKGCGSKNLWQYWSKNSVDKHIFDEYDIITFDIFDTLITRRILEPDFAFLLLEHKIVKIFNQHIDFTIQRKLAENNFRRKDGYKGDCSIDDIYVEFANITGLSSDVCNIIKEMEIENEIELCIPKADIVEFLNYAILKGKKVFLITDMYLRKQDIKRILDKCNISGYDDIWLSCDKRKRKDNGTMWDLFQKEYGLLKCLHIGDNEHSDIQQIVDRKIGHYHVMSSLNLFVNTHIGNYIYDRYREKLRWGDAALLGTIVAKEFNSPFALSSFNGVYQLRSFQSLGYVIFGPILLYFVIWLYKANCKDKVDVVLFLSREGYLLEKLYNKFGSILGQPQNDTVYFLCSRRAASISILKDHNAIADFVKRSQFNGTIADLLYYRFGVKINSVDPNLEKHIVLPQDYKIVEEAIKLYSDLILKNVNKEKNAYLKYCQMMDLNKYSNMAVVDLGYAGTIQYYLSNLLGKPIKGYYVVTSDAQKGLQYNGNTMSGCYGEKEPYFQTDKSIYKYHLLLESVLTSPNGQLEYFKLIDDSVIPVFGEPGYSQQKFSSIQQIHDGINQYFEDVLNTYKENVLEMPITEDLLQDLLGLIVWSDSSLSEEIKKIFSVEDNYCSSSEISVFDLYKSFSNH